MDGTCWASTCKSGSAMVIITPITNAMATITGIFFTRSICTPMPSPSGDIAISAPS